MSDLPPLTEYWTSNVELTDDELRYLISFTKGSVEEGEPRVIDSITPTGTSGEWAVRAGPYVGRLGLPTGRWLDFTSRFTFPDVLELIRVSGRLPIRTDLLHTDSAQATFLIDLIASVFTRKVESIVGRGLAKGYVQRRFLEPPFPGRIDVTYHLSRLAARPDRMVTLARRMTMDILENQVLAYALEVLRRVPLKDGVAIRIARLGPAFRRVGYRPVAASEVAGITPTKLNDRYRDALALAELILRSQEIAPRETGLSGGSILFNMPKVWENYVTQWVESQWPVPYRVEQAHGFNLTTDGGLRAEADVVVWDRGELVALYDAKYKWPEKAPSRGDVYQMVTYCERLGLSEATLVYPVKTDARTVTVTGKTIRVLGIDAPKSVHGEPLESLGV